MSTTEVGDQATGPVDHPDLAEQPGQRSGPTTGRSDSDTTGVRWRTGRRVLRVAAPALLYLAVREFGLLVLAWLAAANNTTVTAALTSWDGQWYLGIAAGGYSKVPGGMTDAFGHRTADTPLAFFPGYPWLVRLVGELPGVGLVAAAFTVTLVCGVACAYGLDRLGRRVGGSAVVGLVLVVLFAASPMGISLSMAYSEAVFCALAVWSLVGVLERTWLLAGLAAAGTGLVRPTAAALVATVVIAAVVAIVRRRDGVWPWVGLVTAPAGLLGYLGYVAHRTGHLTGWFQLQEQGWDSRFDGGVASVRFAIQVLTTGRSVLEVVTVAVLLAAVALVVVAIRQRVAWPLVLYGALVLAMDLGANGLMNSKARLLLPAFPLLIPIAVGLAKRRPGTVVAVLAGVTVASAWFGAYAITAWPYAI
ncbi:MAG TPA: hypothetical protein VHV49_22240 [Pseudonocardiaceae bacterium]|nr:hypothetical protein [Pseudonocardiaceae bacterium]